MANALGISGWFTEALAHKLWWKRGISCTDEWLGSSGLTDPMVERGIPTKWWFWGGGACATLSAEFKKSILG